MRTRPLPPYLQRWRDRRTGKVHVRFRRRGFKTVELSQPIGSPEFWADYNVAMAGKANDVGDKRYSKPGSISAAFASYYESQHWKALSHGTRSLRRPSLEKFRNRYGEWQLQQLTERFLAAYLDKLKPHAARNTLKAFRGWLVHARFDVTRNVKLPKAPTNKHPSWPADVMAQYEAHHAIGTKARLVFGIARYTGLATSDIARLGPRHITADGMISIERQKTGVMSNPVVLPELRAILEATPVTGFTTFVVTKAGKAFRSGELCDEFRRWCNAAGVPDKYSIHGLRHTLGDAMAEAGCQPGEIGAVLGHKSAKTSLHYTQGANRQLLARTAMARLVSMGRSAQTLSPSVMPMKRGDS